MNNYDNVDNEELIALYNSGDKMAVEELLYRNKALVSSIARPYFLIGGSTDDLIQEGMIGLHKAIITYDSSKGIKFKSLAITCIKSAILDALKIANRDKHKALNDSISIQEVSADREESISPEEVIIDEEKKEQLKDMIYSFLSAPQKKVLSLYLEGYNYNEIANEMGKDYKYVDNALRIIKNKIRKSLHIDN